MIMNEFMLNPTRIDRPRSIFPIGFRAPTSMKVGEITPLMVKEVLPGDTWSFDLSSVIVSYSPFVSRVYGDLFLDVYAFFVPNRLVWTHWQQFCGENDTGAWTQKNSYSVPKGQWNLSSSSVGSIGDHMGLPILNTSTLVNNAINELPLRGYARIYNEWFRNENTDSAILVSYGDLSNSTVIKYTDSLKTACRFADYFSMALPNAQKGGSVEVPLGTWAPLVVNSSADLDTIHHSLSGAIAYDTSGNKLNGTFVGLGTSGLVSNGTTSGTSNLIDATNIGADLTKATAATINQWRIAFQTQKYLELMARGGSRYIESLKSLFGVTNGDARLQRITP